MNELPKDPAMLLSWVNMKLRDCYDSLADLCDDLDIEPADITRPLETIGYTYHIDINQFR